MGLLVLFELIALSSRMCSALVKQSGGCSSGACRGLSQKPPYLRGISKAMPLNFEVDSEFWEQISTELHEDYELMLRRSIYKGRWDDCKELISLVSSTILPSGRNMVYILSETCRRSNNAEQIIPLLKELEHNIEGGAFDCLEGDIVPVLNRFIKQREVGLAQDIVDYLEERGAPISVKSYSILITGWYVI